MVNVSINKIQKFRQKTIDYVFLGYAFHNMGYRFLIIDFGVHFRNVVTIMESIYSIFLD
jgi:hypothetical protein